MRINSCLWGGKFNPIIPFFRKIPPWWQAYNYRTDTAYQIINGYLDLYEPDFIVEAEEGLASGLEFDSKRVLQMSEVLYHEGDRPGQQYGFDTFDIYKKLYEETFQFERRHKHNITSVAAEDSRFEAFCACVFGSFPKEPGLSYIGRAFEEAFDPRKVSLNGTALSKLYQSGLTSVLDIGHSKIDVAYNDRIDTSFFVFNALESRDLIDFWNLRTLQRRLIPIPSEWIDELSGYYRNRIEEVFRTSEDRPNGGSYPISVTYSRSIPQENISEISRKLGTFNGPEIRVREQSYPAIWRSDPNDYSRSLRPLLTATKKVFDLEHSEDNPNVVFDSLSPDFAREYGNKNRWANVIKLRDWSFKNQIAMAFPTDYKNPKFSPFNRGGEICIPSTEGFVMFPRYLSVSHHWKLQDGMSVMRDWFKASNIDVKLSESGKVTQQIIQTLGGFRGVRNIASRGIVKLLNEISRKPITKSMQHQMFINKVNAVVKDNIWVNDPAQELVERNAVELGLELKCPKCSSWSWYSLKQLDHKVDCSLCLREFEFPHISPSASKCSRWAYRLIGPFAVPDYSNGGYAASLSIRFFSEVFGRHEANVTWSSGQELTFPDGNKVEADFVLWYQRASMSGNNFPTEIVFGEAKSFGREGSMNPLSVARRSMDKDVIKKEDVDRMKCLAEKFLGAVVVFATMKEAGDLSAAEIKRLRKLAEWGREHIKGSQRTRAPVIVLTGTELFAGYSLTETWDEKGGKHKELVSRAIHLTDQLRSLADLTQQLYLGMPSYSDWLESKWEARRSKLDKQ